MGLPGPTPGEGVPDPHHPHMHWGGSFPRGAGAWQPCGTHRAGAKPRTTELPLLLQLRNPTGIVVVDRLGDFPPLDDAGGNWRAGSRSATIPPAEVSHFAQSRRRLALSGLHRITQGSRRNHLYFMLH